MDMGVGINKFDFIPPPFKQKKKNLDYVSIVCIFILYSNCVLQNIHME